MSAMASQITSLTIVYSRVYSGPDQRKHQSSTSLTFVGEFTGGRWISAQRASNAENVSIWWRHHVFQNSFPRIGSTHRTTWLSHHGNYTQSWLAKTTPFITVIWALRDSKDKHLLLTKSCLYSFCKTPLSRNDSLFKMPRFVSLGSSASERNTAYVSVVFEARI